ncbi:MAG: phosphoheptose isomerase [Flammeovirgaceae bacterium]|nr:phosphoheptose isomerase [Flammeovirgaceae bacterium]|tara:strand:- start:10 stop:564 length:555 start_codon:yes stop_codon:yes gene_type:complete
MKKKINQHIANHLNLLNENKNLILNVTLFIAKEIRKTYKRNGTVFLAGNGGSAADCEHIAGELVGRYKKNRKPLSAISLTTDTSVITCIANDFGYDKIFERQFEGNANRNDLLIVMSTSGNSKNIINVLKKAKQKKIMSIAMLGKNGGKCRKVAKHSFIVPSNNTANIQEAHHLIGHLVCSVFG